MSHWHAGLSPVPLPLPPPPPPPRGAGWDRKHLSPLQTSNSTADIINPSAAAAPPSGETWRETGKEEEKEGIPIGGWIQVGGARKQHLRIQLIKLERWLVAVATNHLRLSSRSTSLSVGRCAKGRGLTLYIGHIRAQKVSQSSK